MPTERRKNPRLGLAIPLRVHGFHADGTSWDAMTTTMDVSSGGACFPLGHDAELGQVLLLSLALPRRLRQYDPADESYRVYSIVRGVRRTTEPARVGVMFFGKYPPRGFQEKPAARYLLPTDLLVNSPAPQGLRQGDPDASPSLDTLVGEPTGSPRPGPRRVRTTRAAPAQPRRRRRPRRSPALERASPKRPCPAPAARTSRPRTGCRRTGASPRACSSS